MNAILLCAGFGTRMYPLTKKTAKALLPLGKRVVLDFLIDQLMELESIDDIHLVSNNLFYPQFQKWKTAKMDDFEGHGIRLHLYRDGVNTNEERLGAVGDLHFVMDKANLWGQPAMVFAGDNLFLFSFRPVMEKFIETGKNTVVALFERNIKRLQRTGVIKLSEDGKITRFVEKPAYPFSNLFCPPAYFLTQASFDQIPEYLDLAKNKDAIGGFIKYLVENSEVYALELDGERLDIGSIEDYSAAQKIFND